ncbi:MAG: DUF5522 domain-containing protein [Ginsengibacter sp.]
MNQELVANDDYYFDDHGFMVFTAAYLLRRGTCCGNGCRHCPYYFENVPEPARSELLRRMEKDPPPDILNKNK